jgi:hypothetical protein
MGSYMQPTLLTDVPQTSRITREETFGPGNKYLYTHIYMYTYSRVYMYICYAHHSQGDFWAWPTNICTHTYIWKCILDNKYLWARQQVFV